MRTSSGYCSGISVSRHSEKVRPNDRIRVETVKYNIRLVLRVPITELWGRWSWGSCSKVMTYEQFQSGKWSLILISMTTPRKQLPL